MRLDDFVQVCYLICTCEWTFSFKCDQWWSMLAECEHKRFSAKPPVLAPEQGLTKLYELISNYHEEM